MALNRRALRNLISAGVTLTVTGGLGSATEQRALGATNMPRGVYNARQPQRPASQAGVPNSSSYIERSIPWPAGSFNSLEFDYNVESEPGWDFLRAKVDGTVVGEWSGAKAGHLHVAVSPGTHVVRFEYTKDGSVDRALDSAWIDNIVATNSAIGIFEQHKFDERNEGLTGWASGGTNGPWTVAEPPVKRILRRPSSQAFTGYQASSSVSSIQRQIYFPGVITNSLLFSYLVDSEPNYDFFRLYIDGVQQYSVSGYETSVKRIDVSPGWHTVRFSYIKDTSVDTGRDTAFVDNVQVFSDSATYELHLFDGTPLGAAPYGWTTNGTDLPWVTTDPEPPKAQVEIGVPTTPPTIDGLISLSEWADRTEIAFPDQVSQTSKRGTVFFRGDAASQAIYIGLRVARATAAAGGEQGRVTLLLDSERALTLRTKGCGPNNVSPGESDRRVVIEYTDSTITSVTQYAGSCQTFTWTALAAGAPSAWPLVVAASEPASDPDFFHIELKVTARETSASTSVPFDEARLGIGVLHQNLVGNLTAAVLPANDNATFNEYDVASWTTLQIGNPNWSDRPLEGRVDGYPVLAPNVPLE